MTPVLPTESQQKVEALIKEIDAVYALEFNDAKKTRVEELRKTYDSFSDEEKAAVTNYKLLTDMEETISHMSEAADDPVNGFTD